MSSLDRRRFLQLAGGASALSLLPTSIARAASIPASRRTGTIEDVEHIVVLMQENRSFDHYFGTMRGVRGFGDPHPVVLPNGQPVWNQSGTYPFRPDMDDLGLAFIQDLDHGWDGGHAAFDRGRYDQWVPVKSTTTMAHLERRDIPFHYALADAFTLCDDYHCSLLGPTDPNRYYMWTGWVGNDRRGGGPVIGNDELGYSWTTYPERLQRAGVSWKIYQDAGLGLDKDGVWGYTDDAYIGNYGDNSLLYFDQYRNAAPGSPLYDRARTGTSAHTGESFFSALARDVRRNQLPQISWIVAPEAFTEHPNWPANYGAWYVSKVLDALTANPDVWSRTALLLTYDENDGFFDHVVPPVAGRPSDSTVSLTNEHYAGTGTTPGGSTGTPGPYGLGQRVPMTVISPWSTGGWVCSETFDHTSIIRFMEARFGVHEPNITAWRRAVCGDLTSAFDFDRPTRPRLSLPSTAAYKPKDDKRHPDYRPVPPVSPALPRQERGTRPSRALDYDVDVTVRVSAKALRFDLVNRGQLGAGLQARSAPADPVPYTLGRGTSLSTSRAAAGPYDVSFHGPDGFFRRFAGTTTSASLEVALSRRRDALVLINSGAQPVRVHVTDAYGSDRDLVVSGRSELPLRAERSGGWYDLEVTTRAGFLRHLAGRVHDGHHGTTDPQLGR